MKQSGLSSAGENERDEVHDVVRRGPKRYTKMFGVCKEFCFVFAVTFTAYATVLNSQSKTKKGPVPEPFFYKGSLVDDFYRGNLGQLMQRVSSAGLSFVMFYSPWDADCQDMRDDFEQTAQFYFKHLYFAGVNCWEPGSECRTTFKDVSSFPQLIAYNGPRKAIEYRGRHDADHMIRFINSLLHPLVRVNTVADVWRLRYLHDAVAVGHLKFDGMSGGVAYRVLYETSLRFAGRDHERNTAFAVFTHDKSNSLMNISQTPSIVLHLWDRKIVYTGELNTESLYKWILGHSSRGLAKINSKTILTHMKTGSVVVMFTPRHPLASLTPYYQMFRRIAMKFNSCGNMSGLTQDDFLTHVLEYDDLYVHYGQEILRAEKLQREECAITHKPKLAKCSKLTTTISTRLWDNLTCFEAVSSHSCSEDANQEHGSIRNAFRDPGSRADWRSTEQVVAALRDEKCALLERTPRPSVPPRRPITLSTVPATACQINTTLTFVALDSVWYGHLAQGLGIQLRRRKHNTAVVLVTGEETKQLKSEEVREDTIMRLLSDYVNSEASRYLRSQRIKTQLEDLTHDSVVVTEVNSLTFETIIMNNTQTVIVLYNSPYCSFCGGISPTFLFVAHLFRSLPGVRMVMIDGENNDLPWQYTVHTYPSILIFPAYRKEESRMFPQWLPVTVTSLSQFIVANLAIEDRVQGLLALCARWGHNPELSEEGDSCLRSARAGCLELISDTLGHYRSVALRLRYHRHNRKHLRSVLKHLLLRLQYLKGLHLMLKRVSDLRTTLESMEELRTTINMPMTRTKTL